MYKAHISPHPHPFRETRSVGIKHTRGISEANPCGLSAQDILDEQIEIDYFAAGIH